MDTRRRWIRFAVGMVLASAMLALALSGSFGPTPSEVLDFYLEPQRGPKPGLNPCDHYVTPIPPDQVRRDSARARIQSRMFEQRFSSQRPLWLVVVGHGYAHELGQTRFGLVRRETFRWEALLAPEARILDTKDDPNPPQFRIGAIASLPDLTPGHHRIHVRMPCGPELVDHEVEFTVVAGEEGAPREFLSEQEMLRGGFRSTDLTTLQYLVTQELPGTLGLPRSELATEDPTISWPANPSAVSTQGCPWGNEPWFAEGVARLAVYPDDAGVRSWAAFALAILALDRPAYRTRLLDCAKSSFGYEATRMLALQGDAGALALLLQMTERGDGAMASGLLRLWVTAVAAAVRSGRPRLEWRPGEPAPPWDAAARGLTDPTLGWSTDGRAALTELLALCWPETLPAVARAAPGLGTEQALRLIGIIGGRTPDVPRAPLVQAFASGASPALRLEALVALNGGKDAPEPAVGAVVADWLLDPATRAFSRFGRSVAREAAIALRRHADSAAASALAAAMADARLGWNDRTAFALALARVGDQRHAGDLNAYLAAAREAGQPDLDGLARAISALPPRRE